MFPLLPLIAGRREQTALTGLRSARLLAGATCLAFATPLFAHEENSTGGGFVTGLMHPILGFDHLLAMVAVGLWGAVLGRPLLYLLPIIFPTIMTLGAIIGMSDFPIGFLEIGIALSVLCLGAFIAFRIRPPVWGAALIVAIFAIFHGYAHGRELPLTLDPVAYSAGFVLATGALHLAGVGLGWAAGSLKNERRVLQAAGASIAAAGVFFLYGAAQG